MAHPAKAVEMNEIDEHERAKCAHLRGQFKNQPPIG
jgi:hypothetical protein